MQNTASCAHLLEFQLIVFALSFQTVKLLFSRPFSHVRSISIFQLRHRTLYSESGPSDNRFAFVTDISWLIIFNKRIHRVCLITIYHIFCVLLAKYPIKIQNKTRRYTGPIWNAFSVVSKPLMILKDLFSATWVFILEWFYVEFPAFFYEWHVR